MTSPVVQTANRPGDEEGEKIATTTPVIQRAGKPGHGSRTARPERSDRRNAGEPITAQYDAPFIPGPFRRNEVLIPVSREQPPP